MEITLHELRAQYVDLVNAVIGGSKVEVRGDVTRELTGVTLTIPDVRRPVLPIGTGRKINARFAAVETLEVIAGTFHGDLVDAAAPGWRDVLVDPARAEAGAYGPRIHGSLDDIATLLQEDPYSRQAVAAIWRATDLIRIGDKPCTLFLQFIQRDGQLNLHSSMRSQDVWLGVPYDLFMFTQLLLTMADWLSMGPGALIHHVTSLHIYERNLDATERLFNPPKELVTPLPLGVVVPEASGRINRPSLVARDLLSPTPWWPCREANPWYAKMMEETHDRLRLERAVE